jgi:hypothetical protein
MDCPYQKAFQTKVIVEGFLSGLTKFLVGKI